MLKYLATLLLSGFLVFGNVVTVNTSDTGSHVVATEVWVSPSVTTNPTNMSVLTNTSVSFTVVVSGSVPSYFWRTNGVVLNNGGIVSGARTATLTISSAPLTWDGFLIDCLGSNPCAVVTSASAILTVTNSSTPQFPANYSWIAWYQSYYAVTNTSGNAVVANDPIMVLGDKSGNQNVLTAPSSPSFVYKTGIQNGHPAIDAAHNSYLEIATLTQGTESQPLTMYFVGSSIAAGGQVFAVTSYRGLNCSLSILDNDHSILYAGTVLSSAGTTANAWHVWTCVFNGASSVLRIDGQQVAAGDIGSGSLVGLSLLGYQPDPTLHWPAYFGECFVAAGVDDSTKMGLMENYCATNWGITLP